MSTALNPLLSEAEIEDLAQRLKRIQTAGALSLEGVDGLFCALVASSELTAPSDYLPVILGSDPGQSGGFADLDDANATMSLLMRYWNSVVADFERESIHIPFIVEPGIDGISGRAWARGYRQGTRLAPLGWDELWTSTSEEQWMSIPIVAGEVDPEWPKEPLTDEKREALLEGMMLAASRAFKHFAQARHEGALSMVSARDDYQDADDYYPDTYVRESPKVGRNELCPCGSGKKYKKCCLKQDELNEREARTTAAAALAASQAEEDEFYEWSARLDEESNAVIDLIEADKLDEAEQAARRLINNYPAVHDGYDRLGMVYEARQEPKKAAECYRRVIEFIEENPTDYDPALLADFRELVQELDPSASADPTA
jgi:uncharacterized protein